MGSIVALDQGMGRYGVVWEQHRQLDDEDATPLGIFVTELRLKL